MSELDYLVSIADSCYNSSLKLNSILDATYITSIYERFVFTLLVFACIFIIAACIKYLFGQRGKG